MVGKSVSRLQNCAADCGTNENGHVRALFVPLRSASKVATI